MYTLIYQLFIVQIVNMHLNHSVKNKGPDLYICSRKLEINAKRNMHFSSCFVELHPLLGSNKNEGRHLDSFETVT